MQFTDLKSQQQSPLVAFLARTVLVTSIYRMWALHGRRTVKEGGVILGEVDSCDRR